MSTRIKIDARNILKNKIVAERILVEPVPTILLLVILSVPTYAVWWDKGRYRTSLYYIAMSEHQKTVVQVQIISILFYVIPIISPLRNFVIILPLTNCPTPIC